MNFLYYNPNLKYFFGWMGVVGEGVAGVSGLFLL